MKEKMTLRMWFTLIGLTFCAFIFNTSEFIPIGLLTDIAKDFNLTEADAGMMISVYAWMVMLLSMPLMVITSKIELKRLMLVLVALFTVFQVCSFLSTSFIILLLSRIGVACTHAIFWSIVSPLAVKLVPQRFHALALSTVVTGSSVAMVLGMPLGRLIGLALGWRMTFLSIGIFSFATLIYIAVTLPTVPSDGKFSLSQVPMLLKNKVLVTIYILALTIPMAHYTGYGYIEPFLLKVAHFSESAITTTLMLFGIAGFFGSLMFARYYKKNTTVFNYCSMIATMIALALLQISTVDTILPVAVCIVWGIAMTAFNVAMQAEIIECSPRVGTAVSMSIFSGIYNLGIGSGTYIGGAVCTHLGISMIGYVGAVIVLLTLILLKTGLLRLPPKSKS